MRIVLVMPDPPLPFGNAAGRWYYVLFRELVARGHKVTTFAAFARSDEAEEARRLFPTSSFDMRLFPFPPVKEDLWSKFNSFVRPYSYMFSSEMKRELEQELSRGFDVLHLEQLWSGYLGFRYFSRAVINIHYLFSIDQEDAQQEGFIARLRQRRVLSTERRILRHYPVIMTLSPRLGHRISALSPASTVSIVPLGIETGLYPYMNGGCVREPVVSLIGSMNWHPTYSAAVRLITRLWPEIKNRVPNAKLQIVGWRAQSALKDYLGLTDVMIDENVPDTRPYFERTGVLLYAPTRGSGMKVKVLEALAYGVPVVTTGEGVEGLPAVDGVHAGVCEDDDGLIERTVALLNDTARQKQQRMAGRSLLENHCGPKPTVDAVQRVYSQILVNQSKLCK